MIQNKAKDENPHEWNNFRSTALEKTSEECFGFHIPNRINKLMQWKTKKMGKVVCLTSPQVL